MDTITKEQWIELIKLYYEEWKFRQEELWKKATQLMVIIFFTSTLPITISFFGPINIDSIPLCLFPFSGILFTIFFLVYFLSNALRINAIDEKRKKLIEKCYGDGLSRFDLSPFFEKNKKKGKRPFIIFRWRMSIWVPLFLSFIEIAVSIAMLYMIRNGMIIYVAP